MTQDEIIRLAREAGFTELAINFADNMRDLERFAALVAAHEREKLAEQEPVAWMNDSAPMGVFARHKEGAENFGCTIPLYAAPVRTKDLTDKQIEKVWNKNGGYMGMPIDFARAVIAADREKNKCQ